MSGLVQDQADKRGIENTTHHFAIGSIFCSILVFPSANLGSELHTKDNSGDANRERWAYGGRVIRTSPELIQPEKLQRSPRSIPSI